LEPSLSVVIVAHNSAGDLARTLPALAGELLPGDELVVVDNDSRDDLGSVVADSFPSARIIPMGRNAGFAAGANCGAAEANGDLLLILNPDARPEPGFGRAIRAPAAVHPDWAAWMGLVTYHRSGRELINSCGNPVHFTGIVPAGGHGRPATAAGAAGPVPTASGACLAVRREIWDRLGGFAGPFFLYHEDVDFSLRLRSEGGELGIEPRAVVDHDYEFGGGLAKWHWLERNRWATIIRTYPAGLLILLLPALAVTELAIGLAAVRAGWFGEKARAWCDLIGWLPRLLAERASIQARRKITAGEFARILTPDLDSPFLPAAVGGGPVRAALRAYWRLVLVLLGR
jgi:GT2 family glycosyltransferase